MRPKRAAAKMTTPKTTRSATLAARRILHEEEEEGDGAPRKKIPNLTPPENPNSVGDSSSPPSGDISEEIDQIMKKLMMDQDLKDKLRRTFRIDCSTEVQPCVLDERVATPDSTVEEMIVLVDPTTSNSTVTPAMTPTHDDDDEEMEMEMEEDDEVLIISDNEDDEVVVIDDDDEEMVVVPDEEIEVGDEVVIDSADDEGVVVADEEEVVVADEEEVVAADDEVVIVSSTPADPTPAPTLPGIRIRSDLYEPEDLEITAIFADLNKKSVLISSSVTQVLSKFIASLSPKNSTSSAEKLKNFHDLQTTLSLSIGILDVANVALQTNETYAASHQQSRFSYEHVQRITTEEMGDYFLKLLAVTIFLKVEACLSFRPQITLIHYRVCRLLNYYAILGGPPDPENTLQNILLSIMPELQRFNVSTEAITRAWDKIGMFHLEATYVKHCVFFDHVTLGVTGFGRQLNRILGKVKELVYKSMQMTPPPERTNSTYSFGDDMYTFYEITGRWLEVIPATGMNTTRNQNAQPRMTTFLGANNQPQSPVSLLLQGFMCEDVFRTPTASPVRMGYSPVPRMGGIMHRSPTTPQMGGYSPVPMGAQNRVIRPPPQQMGGYSPIPSPVRRPPPPQMGGFYPVPSIPLMQIGAQNGIPFNSAPWPMDYSQIRSQGFPNSRPQMAGYSQLRSPAPMGFPNNPGQMAGYSQLRSPAPMGSSVARPSTPRPMQITDYSSPVRNPGLQDNLLARPPIPQMTLYSLLQSAGQTGSSQTRPSTPQMAWYSPLQTTCPQNNISTPPPAPRPMQMAGYSPVPSPLAGPGLQNMAGYSPIPSPGLQNMMTRPLQPPQTVGNYPIQIPANTPLQNMAVRPSTFQIAGDFPIRPPEPMGPPQSNVIPRRPRTEMSAHSVIRTLAPRINRRPSTPRPIQAKNQSQTPSGHSGSQTNSNLDQLNNAKTSVAYFLAARRALGPPNDATTTTTTTTNSPGGAGLAPSSGQLASSSSSEERLAPLSSSRQARPTSNYPRFLRK